MRLIIIDVAELLHLDSWNVSAVPRRGELIELRAKNWKVESVKWVKSAKQQEAGELLKRFLGKTGTDFSISEVFVAVFVSRYHSDNEGLKLPLLTSQNIKKPEDEKA